MFNPFRRKPTSILLRQASRDLSRIAAALEDLRDHTLNGGVRRTLADLSGGDEDDFDDITYSRDVDAFEAGELKGTRSTYRRQG